MNREFVMRWIPVTERLPEKDGDYLCTVEVGVKDGSDDKATYVDVLSYGHNVNSIWKGDEAMFADGSAFGELWKSVDGIGEIDNISKVLAWMPLPEEYEVRK